MKHPKSDTFEILPVLIVGGGLGGSAAAAFLAHGGIDTIVLERHPEPNDRPRAWIISPRTLELLRELGIDSQITERGSAGTWDMVQTDTLLNAPAGTPPVDKGAAVSATGSATCDQDILENILRNFAVEHGADMRWGSTVVDITDHGDSIDAHLHDGSIVTGRYAIVADGARAGLLEALNISSTVPDGGNPSPEERFEGILFRSSELDTLMASTAGNAFLCTGSGSIVFRRDLNRWQLQRQGQTINDPAQQIAETVGQAVDFDLLDQSSWTPSAHSADHYRTGNAFLVGDAAHSFPPSLGMGGNAAIADAHNLAWKLRWVLTQEAGDLLLDTYEPERKPVGTFIMQSSIDHTDGDENNPIDLLTVQVGLGYPAGPSTALIGSGHNVTVTNPHETTPLVGARLPHSWLPDGRSTVDLTTIDTFAAVGTLDADRVDLPVPYTQVPNLPTEGGPDALWLIRPDGHVAAHIHPEQVMTTINTILSHTASS